MMAIFGFSLGAKPQKKEWLGCFANLPLTIA
jgi:hypothetical protein